MGGGLLQLVAYGAQDVYLTGNPQITFFKVVYRRHTNFALESIQQTFNGSVGYGNRVTATISRNGDLINRAYLVLDINATNASSVPYVGLKAIQYAELEIGGQKIDKHYGEWMYIWNELSLPVGKQSGYNTMVGSGGLAAGDNRLYVPLEFWFCRNVGLALPLIGLQYHEVKVNLQFESATNLGVVASDKFGAELWVDYVYLDTDERRKFAQSSHEYLIEQLQFTGRELAGSKIKLNFNHPVKELVWVCHNRTDVKDWINYTDKASHSIDGDNNDALVDSTTLKVIDAISSNGGANLCASAKLTLNGNDRFATREGKYFNLVQPFQHHENIPANSGINVYSFALKPEEHQPSGTLNMSRIDTATLDLTYKPLNKGEASTSTAANPVERTIDSTFESPKVSQVSIYAVNYNVLRILSGMGGIAYSN